jgi:aspartyl aminopeptidase
MKMQLDDFNKGLMDFLDASPTPFHAVLQMQKMLEASGFERLDEKTSWALETEKKYYVTRNDSSIIAFSLPKEEEGFVMLGAHTDSPNLKIKPNPVVISNGLVQLGVEPYGGLLMNPWFDRDLSIAGRVNYLDDEGKMLESLVDFKAPVAAIPSLAIHLDADANKKRSVNAQTDIVPLIASGDYFDFEAMLLKQLEKEGKPARKLLSHELSLYDTQKAGVVGLEGEFIASARLDNLLSCYVATQVLCNGADRPLLMVCSDHEEVGSESVSGAAGPFLENILRRIGGTYEQYAQLLRRSMLVSCDNAHAVHPNFASKHDANHAPKINRGPVIKINANQRYASNSTTVSRFIHAAQKAGRELQHFVTRSDMGCGSTIGPITASRLGVETIDVGLPTFAMHSIRELAGSEDALTLYEILLRLSERHGLE